MAKKKISTTEDKLSGVISELESMFGEGVVMKLSDKNLTKIDFIPTGSIGLDQALGIGGIPVGRIVEIYGKESSGKTSLAISIAREAQIKFPDKQIAYIDAENAFDYLYARNVGLDLKRMIFSQPDYGEQGMDIVLKCAESGAFSVIVVDSVTALTPKAEIEGEMTDHNIGLQARLMSKGLRKLAGPASKSGTTVVFINQIRANIGVMGYGPKETTTGGNGLKFFSSVRIDTRVIKKEESYVVIKSKVVKNKVAPPFREADYEIQFGKGISEYGEIIDYGIMFDVIQKKGAWFNYGDVSLGQGREKVKYLFESNPDLYLEIKTKVMLSLEGDPDGTE